MQVKDLIEALSELDPEKEVMLATQPSWPLAFKVDGVFDPDTEGLAAPDHDFSDEEHPSVVWIVQGNQSDDPYGVPRDAFDVGMY